MIDKRLEIETKTICGGNYFTESRLQEMIEALESGNIITIYISCIGHTRAQREALEYRNALIERYGERLEIVDTFWDKGYRLKEA